MKTTLLLVFSIVSLSILGQQQAQFTQYYNNPYYLNPAAGGITKTIDVDLGYRRQWMGIEGSPQSIYATVNSEISFDRRNVVLQSLKEDTLFGFSSPNNSVGINKNVVGGRVVYDQIGPFSTTSVMASYAYHLRLTQKTMLGLGVSGGISNFGIMTSKVVLLDHDDDQYADFLSHNNNQTIFNLNAGLVFYGEHFQLGVSSTQILQNELKIDEITTQSHFNRHWYIYGMYDFPLGISNVSIEPHFLIQIVEHAPVSFDIGSLLHFNHRFWANISYRYQDAISIGAGLNFAKNIRLGYTYDIAIGKVQRPSNYVHEINLGLVFGRSKNKEMMLKNEGKL